MCTSIKLENIRLYAYHGCLLEEAKIGSDYRVDISVTADLSRSMQTDDLKDTVDYVILHKIVASQMAVRSNLLENVASRIIFQVFNDFAAVVHIKITVAKLNPPIGGDVFSVAVSQDISRETFLKASAR